jgi:Restriction endonuclease
MYKTLRIYIQCKYKTNGKVSPGEIRDFIGATSNDPDVIAVFVTNNDYSIKSKNTVKSNRRNIYLTTNNSDDDNYIGKLLDEMINYENTRVQENKDKSILTNVEIDIHENSVTEYKNDNIIINGSCKIKINCK